MRVISVAYYALVERALLDRAPIGEGARLCTVSVPWAGEAGGHIDLLDDLGDEIEAAFDHREMLGMAVKRLRGKLNYAPVGSSAYTSSFSARAPTKTRSAAGCSPRVSSSRPARSRTASTTDRRPSTAGFLKETPIAEIQRFPFVRHVRFNPSAYVLNKHEAVRKNCTCKNYARDDE